MNRVAAQLNSIVFKCWLFDRYWTSELSWKFWRRRVAQLVRVHTAPRAVQSLASRRERGTASRRRQESSSNSVVAAGAWSGEAR